MTPANHEPLEQLVEKATGGNREAFSEIARRLMKPIVALTYRMTGDRDTAFDLAQETFVTAWQRLKSFRGEAGFESWLYRIATNKTLNHLESERRLAAPRATDPDPADNSGTPETILEKRQMREDVLAFMRTLPEQQRVVFNLRFYRELQFDEIATILGKSVGTVKTHYREAVKKLRVFAKAKGWRV